LFGFRDGALINSALSNSATRKTSADIGAFIKFKDHLNNVAG
jgi:hypothetical protein